MKVLIGFSTCNVTRSAFESHGHDVWTCDLRPARHAKHIRGDVWDNLDGWDFGVFHPMCTYLTVSAAWAFSDPDFEKYPDVGYHQAVKPSTLTGSKRREARDKAIADFIKLDSLPYPRAIENPAPSFISKAHRPPDQTIQPYEFGDDASKRTGLWLTGCQDLEPTNYFPPRRCEYKGKFVGRWSNQTASGQNRVSPSSNRWIERSKTYPGIANAMGDQWGKELRRCKT